jgi:hypothetical protein
LVPGLFKRRHAYRQRVKPWHSYSIAIGKIPASISTYGYMDDTGTHLVRISRGRAEELLTFHIGNTNAFEHFQRIRHDTEIHPVPDAVSIFFSGSRDTTNDPVPEGLNPAITSMLRLFAERSERDVGGWPTELLFPRGDLIGMHVELLSKLRNRSIVLQGSQGHLRLEGRCVVPAGSLLHLRS